MNIQFHRHNSFCRAHMLALLLLGIFLAPAFPAQPGEREVQGRFLFIFDTSWAMRNRVETVQNAVTTMLATSLNGQLHSGDSIGVWTFSQDLQTGTFPLQTWNADSAVQIASNISKFIGNQHYGKTARFEALQPLLNQVVQGSERLTVLIFCDGTVKAAGTPFDAGINDAFQQKLADQNKARQPFVILLRSQLGKYTTCAMTFPPAKLNIPDFPPLPPLPAPAAVVTNPPPSAPIITSTAPSLYIVGTKVSTNEPPEIISPPTNAAAPPAIITPPAPSIPTVITTAPPTTQVVVRIVTSVATNSPAVEEAAGSRSKNFLFVGALLLGAGIALGTSLWLRWHRKDSSLITRSMNQRR